MTYTRDQLRENANVFLKVYATARPGDEEFMEFRFPGLTYTGYLIETGSHIMAFLDHLNIKRIEKW